MPGIAAWAEGRKDGSDPNLSIAGRDAMRRAQLSHGQALQYTSVDPGSVSMAVETRPMLTALAINLPRSVDRWERISASVGGSGLVLQRVVAVDGASIPLRDRRDLDVGRFRRYHGRAVLDGEYGCFQSHLAALAAVVEQKLPLAIIAEDDIEFSRGVGERVRSIFAASPKIELLKIANHRASGFILHGTSAMGDQFGRCIHGPQGSAACYAVTQKGAAGLLRALKTMWLPYDIAFERGWSTGVGTYTTPAPLVAMNGPQIATTIATKEEYRAAKLPKIQQIGTALFRGMDYLARMTYAMRGR